MNVLLEAPIHWKVGVVFGFLSREGLLNIEQPKTPERHKLVPIGGRVKMARQPLSLLYGDQFCGPYLRSELPEDAFAVIKGFKNARKRVRGGIKRNFFPLTTREIKGKVKGPGFYRGLLKTDQGPAGMFTGFRISEDSSLNDGRVLINKSSGLAVPEEFFVGELRRKGVDLDILSEVQELFMVGDESEARIALERLDIKCGELGIDLNRRASVGRGPFFFIRPASSENGEVLISHSSTEQIIKTTARLVNRLEAQANLAKELVKKSFSIEQAITEVQKTKTLPASPKSSILYFQPDVILRKDGSFVIDRINIPDVVFFLSQIDPQGSDSFCSVQDIVGELGNVVVDRLVEEITLSGKEKVVMVTRDEVLDSQEDTLELLEIKALTSLLKNKGIDTQISRLSDAVQLSNKAFIMLLNIHPSAPKFNDLLMRSVRDELACYPDPFILLFKEQAHTYPEIHLDSTTISRLRAIIEPIDYNSTAGIYRQFMALESYLRRLGFDQEDIFYFTDGSGRIAPAFRYDLKSFTHGLNDFDDEGISMRGLDFKPEEAKVVSEQGSHLAAFRFMFIKR